MVMQNLLVCFISFHLVSLSVAAWTTMNDTILSNSLPVSLMMRFEWRCSAACFSRMYSMSLRKSFSIKCLSPGVLDTGNQIINKTQDDQWHSDLMEKELGFIACFFFKLSLFSHWRNYFHLLIYWNSLPQQNMCEVLRACLHNLSFSC